MSEWHSYIQMRAMIKAYTPGLGIEGCECGWESRVFGRGQGKVIGRYCMSGTVGYGADVEVYM